MGGHVMRILFSIVGLLVVLAIVALLVSTQLGSSGSVPAPAVEMSAEQATDAANVQQLRQQLNSNPRAVQDAYQQSIEAQMDNTRKRMDSLEKDGG